MNSDLVLSRNFNTLNLNPVDSYALANRNNLAFQGVARDPYIPFLRNPSGISFSRSTLRNRRQRINRRLRNNAVRNIGNIPVINRMYNRRNNFPAGQRYRAFQSRFYNQGSSTLFSNGGSVAPSMAIATSSLAPLSSGFSLSNSGERNITFGKEFVAGFLRINADTKNFAVYQISTHPSLNASVVAISQIYQRYKIMSYQFKYKASCPTTTAGLHFTGVDYGTQTTMPATFDEAESLEHFSVGPIWKDSQDWHELKLANLRERWFDINVNSSDPDSRPARIIFGALGVDGDITSDVAFGLIEVRVTYIFNGLAQHFTGEPPQKMQEITKTISAKLENVQEEDRESSDNYQMIP